MRYISSIVLPIILVLTWVLPVQAKWMNCPDRNRWVEEPNFTRSLENPETNSAEVNFYYTGDGYVILEDTAGGNIRSCFFVGLGKRLSTVLIKDKDTYGGYIRVLVVTETGNRQYYRVDNGEEIYLQKNDQGYLDASDQPAPIEGDKIGVLDNWYGPTSLITTPEYDRITDQFAWKELWGRHAGAGATPPKVLFVSNMVVAIFLGERINSGGVHLYEVRETQDALVFYFDQRSVKSVGGINATSPVGFFVVPRSTKKIILMEKVPGERYGFDPYYWKKVGEIE